MFENNYFEMQENKTEKSPFSVYDKENHKLILPKRRTSLDEVDFLLDKGYIGEWEKLLLIITNNMCFVTSRQITQMFNLAGFANDQAQIQNMLKKLKTKSFIKQIEFFNQSNESMKSSFRAYTLGQHGVGILYASQIKPKLQGYISALPTSTIKKTLAVNQLIISMLQNYPGSFEVLSVVLDKDRKEDGFIIRPNAIVNNENGVYFIDCIRRDDGWKEEFVDRLSRYNKVINDYDSLNYKFNEKPKLIVLAEDSEHCVEVKAFTEAYTDMEISCIDDVSIYNKPYIVKNLS